MADYHRENADEVAKVVRRWRKTRFLSDKDQRRLMIALQNMRMSCNSTYLLDQETDHGVKADELAALFDELFVDPDAKAVVFSQWTRTHDIVIRRLEARGLGYVSFHGGVPSEKRPALIERFRDDPACRVFLSTDAGSTGLNLQHASTLVNMDLPWNPAVLGQRIARIHRMGQTRPVRVINFVAKGTIEEGMLSVLAFQTLVIGGNSRRRQWRDFARRLASQPLHEGRGKRYRADGRGRGRDTGGPPARKISKSRCRHRKPRDNLPMRFRRLRTACGAGLRNERRRGLLQMRRPPKIATSAVDWLVCDLTSQPPGTIEWE